MADLGWWLIALVVCVAPRRVWPRLDSRLPLASAAAPAGLITALVGFAIGVTGFFAFAERQADANNAWMLRQLALPSKGHDTAIGMFPYGMSVITLFVFLFFTPGGLLACYLATTGTLRAVSAWFDDPHGDPLLSGAHWAVTMTVTRNREERRRIARERREGREAPDVLQTGAWAGIDADYIVLASRRKPEWEPGAIILTSADWYRLGVPFDIDTPAGLRTAYPLTRLETVEVVRRGIEYELPRMPRRHDNASRERH